jgi:hypothetical protein
MGHKKQKNSFQRVKAVHLQLLFISSGTAKRRTR